MKRTFIQTATKTISLSREIVVEFPHEIHPDSADPKAMNAALEPLGIATLKLVMKGLKMSKTRMKATARKAIEAQDWMVYIRPGHRRFHIARTLVTKVENRLER